MSVSPRVLILACGNPGRMDDGLGPALAARLEADVPAGVTVEADYQLMIEDAAAVAQHDVVIFVDADKTGPAPYAFRPVAPDTTASFSTHSVSAGAVLALAVSCFQSRARAFALGIRGYAWDAFGERLSPGATDNLNAATRFLRALLRTGHFDEAVTDLPPSAGGTAASEGKPCRMERT